MISSRQFYGYFIDSFSIIYVGVKGESPEYFANALDRAHEYHFSPLFRHTPQKNCAARFFASDVTNEGGRCRDTQRSLIIPD